MPPRLHRKSRESWLRNDTIVSDRFSLSASSIIGALASAEIADWIGRKRTLMAALVISYAAISMEFAATTNALFFGGKFMNGFATGTISCIMVTYIGEVRVYLGDLDRY
jgi:MFS family permease